MCVLDVFVSYFNVQLSPFSSVAFGVVRIILVGSVVHLCVCMSCYPEVEYIPFHRLNGGQSKVIERGEDGELLCRLHFNLIG